MHELLLFGQVPLVSHDQVLKILAGVAAMQPRALKEHHLIFKPNRQPGTTVAKGPIKAGSQAQALQSQLSGELFYLKLVGRLEETADGGSFARRDSQTRDASSQEKTAQDSTDNDVTSKEQHHHASNQEADLAATSNLSGSPVSSSINFAADPWTLEFRDLPEPPGRRPVTSRLMASIPLTGGTPLQFMTALGYSFKSAYTLDGHQLVHKNTILRLYRPLVIPATEPAQPLPMPHSASSTLKLLDPSGTYILEASLRVQDGGKPELMTRGMNELVALRELLKGVVELEVGDRLALDTRVR